MRRWPLLAALLSLLTGAAPEPAEVELEDATERRHVEATAAGGFGVQGDGFFMWDEDRRSAEAWAQELARVARPPRGRG